MTTATKPRIATPVKRERVITTKPKTIRIGHGYYDLKLIRDIISDLPDGEITLISYPGKDATDSHNRYARHSNGKPPRIECAYPRGQFRLVATGIPYYEADKGKVKPAKHLTYYQGEEQPANTFSLLSVELPMQKLAHDMGLIKSEV